jgi:hypothetical protein
MNKALEAKHTLETFAQMIDPKIAEYWDREMGRNFGFNDRQRNLVEMHHSKMYHA